MVSLRRRRLLGLCNGSSFSTPLPLFCENVAAPDNSVKSARSVTVHPLPSDATENPGEKSVANGSPNISASSSSKEQQSLPYPGQPVKRRKQHRRKQVQNQEPCIMRGVYFKNMKWQAAIKVDKKQIHLGTVNSQDEAAHLYDRAAFMCGREPNFELPEEEKEELRRFKWDEFLAFTRSSITNKKHKKRGRPGSQKRSGPKQGSASEDVEPESSSS